MTYPIITLSPENPINSNNLITRAEVRFRTALVRINKKYLTGKTPLCSFDLHSSPQESLSKEIDVLGRKFVSIPARNKQFNFLILPPQALFTSFTLPRCGGCEMGLRSLASVGGATKA
ncbi:hypothetical protein ALC57_14703 [Trachymyrmex cornetzi]|uniref:Uncharacterized protein n=1 Tax=Trachymyrmex cornetzi TaxID=471704 RepID=A0A151IXW4_9HYME|nr:hypothetical protein ALC57_14703 [Trachymyrmex cornetzi]